MLAMGLLAIGATHATTLSGAHGARHGVLARDPSAPKNAMRAAASCAGSGTTLRQQASMGACNELSVSMLSTCE